MHALAFEPSTMAIGMFVGQKLGVLICSHPRLRGHPRQTFDWIKSNKHALLDALTDECSEPLVVQYFNHVQPSVSVGLYALLLLVLIWSQPAVMPVMAHRAVHDPPC